MDDAQRAQAAPAEAFEWVAQELVWPSDAARQALQSAWLAHANKGHQKLARELRQAWAAGVHWPSGEAYAREQGWRPADEQVKGSKHGDDDPAALLASRLAHVAHRIYRDPQVRALIAPTSRIKSQRYSHVCINRNHFHDEERNPCGLLPGALMSIEAGLIFLRQPAHKHPACDCTADPHPI